MKMTNLKRKLMPFTLISVIISTIFLTYPAYTSADHELIKRGYDYEIWRIGYNTFNWVSAVPWIWNGSQYVPYIFEDVYSKVGYYLMRNSFITVKLFDDYAEFWDKDNEEIRVKEEKWLVQYYDKGWITLNKYHLEFDVIVNSSGIFITQYWACRNSIEDKCTFIITYALREAMSLEHFLTVTNEGTNIQEFRIIQEWNGVAANTVKHSKGTTRVTTSTNIYSLWFQFTSDTNDFIVFEDLRSTGYYDTRNAYHNDVLQPATINVSSKGLSVHFTYSNHSLYTLSPRESLYLDPLTKTEEGEWSLTGLMEKYGNFWPPLSGPNVYATHSIEIGKEYDDSGGWKYYLCRGYLSFNTTSIESEWDIDEVELQVYLFYREIKLGNGLSGYPSLFEIYSGKNQWTSLSASDWDDCTTYEEEMTVYADQSYQYYEFDILCNSVARGEGTQRTQFKFMLYYENIAPTSNPLYGNKIEKYAFQNPYSGGNPPKLVVTYTT